jgi:hypothetical protein
MMPNVAAVPPGSLTSGKHFPALCAFSRLGLYGAVWGTLAFTAFAAPAPPRVLLETYPSSARVPGRSLAVAPTTDLQAVLDTARPGDDIVLEAGQRYTGNFILPRKTGAGWITLRSSAMDRLPVEGVRVRPAQAGAMPKLISPNDRPALAAAPGAGFYRMVGLEIAPAEGVEYSIGLVTLGGDQTNLAQSSHDLIFDRVYVHGLPRAALKRGFALNSASTVIANSHIADCHVAGQDAQAIGGWNGPGPYKIVNNYLEGSGENMMFGGADPLVPDLVPADIEIRANHFYKPLAWRQGEPSFGGERWTVKNLLELKNARRVWIEGNVLEYCWAHGQVGFAVVLTPRNQGGKAPWCTVEDVTFVNNIVRHCSSGIGILGEDDNHRSQTTKRLLIRNNLLEDINPTRFGGDGRLLQITTPQRPIAELVIERNTMLHGGRGNTFLCLDGKARVIQGFVFRGNIVTHGQYGIHGSRAMGRAGLETYCDGFEMTRNLIIGPGNSQPWPDGNAVATALQAVCFENPAAGNYRLKPESPFHSISPAGADMDTLATATAGAISGVWRKSKP